ncbi:hypothetical protein GOODEAATRI_009664, partial [Goodea atripinnis]
TYRLHISQDIPQENLAMFYSSYESRTELQMERPVPGLNENTVSTLRYLSGMTRLVRSRTHSASSVGSAEGVRSHSTTNTVLEGAICTSLQNPVVQTMEMTA